MSDVLVPPPLGSKQSVSELLNGFASVLALEADSAADEIHVPLTFLLASLLDTIEQIEGTDAD